MEMTTTVLHLYVDDFLLGTVLSRSSNELMVTRKTDATDIDPPLLLLQTLQNCQFLKFIISQIFYLIKD